jgi:hypothetical protein
VVNSSHESEMAARQLEEEMLENSLAKIDGTIPLARVKYVKEIELQYLDYKSQFGWNGAAGHSLFVCRTRPSWLLEKNGEKWRKIEKIDGM